MADGGDPPPDYQYLEEADELADRIVVVDHGTVIVAGTSAELKAATGGALIHRHPLRRRTPVPGLALEPTWRGLIDVSQDGRRSSAGGTQHRGLGHYRRACARCSRAWWLTTWKSGRRRSTTSSSS